MKTGKTVTGGNTRATLAKRGVMKGTEAGPPRLGAQFCHRLWLWADLVTSPSLDILDCLVGYNPCFITRLLQGLDKIRDMKALCLWPDIKLQYGHPAAPGVFSHRFQDRLHCKRWDCLKVTGQACLLPAASTAGLCLPTYSPLAPF